MQELREKRALPDPREILRGIAFATLIWLACSVNLTVISAVSLKTNLLGSFDSFRFEQLLFFCGLILLYLMAGKITGPSRGGKTPFFLALLFAFFMLFGRAYEKWDSCRPLFQIRNGQFIKAAIFFAGYAVLFHVLIRFIFALLDRACSRTMVEKEPDRKGPRIFIRYTQALRNRPFLTVFLTLLILSVPNLIMSYPARILGDTPPQIVQAYSALRTTGFPFLDAGGRLLKDGVYINQHHPVAHTLLLHIFLLLGDTVTGSLNAGLFLYAIFQAVVLTASCAYACSVMIRKTGPTPAVALLTVLYAAVHPMIINYTCLVTKDTVYAALVLVCLANVFLLLSGENSRRLLILTILSMFGIVLFRNEGRYVLSLFLVLVLLLHRETRKRFACILLAVAVFSAVVFRLLYPALGFTPGSIRETLSIPFQQTARYVRDHSDQVTEQEKEAIDRVLAYDELASRYRPDTRVDYVKDTYRENASGEDLKAYFRVWAQMFRKRPATYAQASMNMYYQFFYPGNARLKIYSANSTRTYMDVANQSLSRIGKQLSQPSGLARIRKWYDDNVKLVRNLPVFNVLLTPAFYSWILVLLLSWTISRKRRKGLCMLLIPVIILAVNLVGPCNGSYARYLFPIILSMPAIIRMTLRLSEQPEKPIPAE